MLEGLSDKNSSVPTRVSEPDFDCRRLSGAVSMSTQENTDGVNVAIGVASQTGPLPSTWEPTAWSGAALLRGLSRPQKRARRGAVCSSHDGVPGLAPRPAQCEEAITESSCRRGLHFTIPISQTPVCNPAHRTRLYFRQMRAVLDTNIARKLGYPGDVDHDDLLAGLRALKRAGFSLHLADGAILELIGQLHEGRLAWPDWIRARGYLRVLLCAHEPIMLGGWEVLVEAGILPPDGRQLPDDMHQTLRLGWKILSKARTLTEIDKPLPVMINGKRTLLANRARRANELVQQEQRSWADGIDELYEEATSKNVSTMGISDVDDLVRVVGATAL